MSCGGLNHGDVLAFTTVSTSRQCEWDLQETHCYGRSGTVVPWWLLTTLKTMEEHRRIHARYWSDFANTSFYWRQDMQNEHTQIEYRTCSGAGLITRDRIKVTGVTEWPYAKTKKEVQSMPWVRKLLCRFSEGLNHARPLLTSRRRMFLRSGMIANI